MKKIIFLEGLPGVGKTTLVNTIKEKNLPNVHIVDEIIKENIVNKISPQLDFAYNDELKLKQYNDGIIIIDRGPISTLSYNETKKIIDPSFNSTIIKSWFDKIKNIYQEDNVFTIYLTNKQSSFQISKNDLDGPYGSKENQKILEEVTIQNIKKYCKNYKIREYYKKDIEVLIDEIIN